MLHDSTVYPPGEQVQSEVILVLVHAVHLATRSLTEYILV